MKQRVKKIDNMHVKDVIRSIINSGVDIAKLSGMVGCHKVTIRNYLNGATYPQPYRAEQIRGIYNFFLENKLPTPVKKIVKKNKCSSCGAEIDVKKWKQRLCENCFNAKSWLYTVDGVEKKYGVDFFVDLYKLSTDCWITLDYVGKKYGITRERVRQLYAKIMEEKYTPLQRPKLNGGDIVCVNHPYHKAATYKGKKARVGAIYEKMFWDMCVDLGCTVTVYKNSKIDMVINGYNVDVKGCGVTTKTGRGAIVEYCHYNISRYQISNCDFIACYHPVEDSFFVIPTTEIKTNPKKAVHIYISEHKTDYYNSKNRYWEYLNRFDLLVK